MPPFLFSAFDHRAVVTVPTNSTNSADAHAAASLGGPVVSVHPNASGTRTVWVDEAHQAFLYSPVDDQARRTRA